MGSTLNLFTSSANGVGKSLVTLASTAASFSRGTPTAVIDLTFRTRTVSHWLEGLYMQGDQQVDPDAVETVEFGKWSDGFGGLGLVRMRASSPTDYSTPGAETLLGDYFLPSLKLARERLPRPEFYLVDTDAHPGDFLGSDRGATTLKAITETSRSDTVFLWYFFTAQELVDQQALFALGETLELFRERNYEAVYVFNFYSPQDSDLFTRLRPIYGLRSIERLMKAPVVHHPVGFDFIRREIAPELVAQSRAQVISIESFTEEVARKFLKKLDGRPRNVLFLPHYREVPSLNRILGAPRDMRGLQEIISPVSQIIREFTGYLHY